MDSTDSTEEKDAGPEVQINFPESVLSRIEELMGDTEQFDCAEFDAVGYINQMFPTEQSLSGVEAAAARCEWRLAAVGRELAVALRRAPARAKGRDALLRAADVTQALALQVADINERATRSECAVREITAEIKQLDRAKGNLTAAITALHHYQMLVGGVASLQAMTDQRQYKEIVLPLQAIMEVLQHFEQYRDIGELSALRDRVATVRNHLTKQLRHDLQLYFTAGASSPLSATQAAAACGALDLLDLKARDELLDWLVDSQLQEYHVLFSPEQELAWLPGLDARYGWLKRQLLQVERSLTTPLTWRLSERVAARYCLVTRQQLSALLTARAAELDVKLLLTSTQKTAAFELLLHKRFNGPEDVPAGDTPADQLHKTESAPVAEVRGEEPVEWRGAIGACFEPHLGLYINSLDGTLRTLMDRFLQEARAQPAADVSGAGAGAGAGAVLSSCAELFLLYKKCLVQCAQLSTGDAMLQLCGVFRQYLAEYANGVLRGAVRGAGGAAGGAGGLPALVNNLHTLLRDEATARLTPAEVARIASVITTAEYCLETTVHLEQKLKEKIKPSLAAAVDLSPEQDLFHKLIGDCIQLLVRDLEAACEPALAAMLRLPWGTLQAVGDQSAYVTQIVSSLRQSVPTLRDHLASSRKYFTQLCIRFASTFIPKLTAAILACKPITTAGAEQLLLDAHMLKTALMELPAAGTAVKRPAPHTYTRLVIKLMTKAEMILKLVMAPLEDPESFAAQFVQLLPDSTPAEFRRVLDMRGVRGARVLAALDAGYRAAAKRQAQQ